MEKLIALEMYNEVIRQLNKIEPLFEYASIRDRITMQDVEYMEQHLVVLCKLVKQAEAMIG